MYNDRILVCKDCGGKFVFTAEEQEFYARKGFVNVPVRCQKCRVLAKERVEMAAIQEAMNRNFAPQTQQCSVCHETYVFTTEDQKERAILRCFSRPMCPRCFTAYRKGMGI